MLTTLKRDADFQDWVGCRSVTIPGSNFESKSLPFQSWRPFKEAFAPEIIYRAVSETPGEVARLIDPFGGSGTSALTSQFIGVEPTTIEVNPFLADLIEAKLISYDVGKLTRDYAAVVGDLKGKDSGQPRSLIGRPPTFVEPGVKDRYIFSKKIAQRLVKLLKAIEENCDQRSARLFKVLTATISIEVSNIVVSGKGRRYRSNWQQRSVSPEQVDNLFQQKALSAIHDISRYGKRPVKDYTLIRGDSRQALACSELHDIAVFSPPYPNSFDYTDVYNVELWLLGYLNSWDENRTLRNSTLRSHVQIKREYSADTTPSPLLAETYDALAKVRDDLWNKDIPEMIVAYFRDMTAVMTNMAKNLRTGGRIYCVVGDSQYVGNPVPVAKILAQMNHGFGLRFLHSETFRSMRVSPQQGGKPELPETLLIFERP